MNGENTFNIEFTNANYNSMFPSTNAKQIPAVDDVLKQQNESMMRQLEQEYKQTSSIIERGMKDEIDGIVNQYKIKRSDMKRRYDTADAESKKRILDQMFTVKSQTQAKIQALRDKNAPAIRELDTAMQQKVTQFQEKFKAQTTRLEFIRNEVTNENIDPAVLKRMEYKAIGVDIPLSELKAANSQAQQRSLLTEIKGIQSILNVYTPATSGKGAFTLAHKATFKDPDTGEKRDLDPKKPEDANIINSMQALIVKRNGLYEQLKQFYLAQNPSIQAAWQKTDNFKNAVKNYSGNDEEVGGSIEASITKQMGPKQSDIINRGGKKWRIVGHDTDGTPLVVEVK